MIAGQVSESDTLEAYRPLLFSIAYRMLGSAAEAEDVVQEAFVRYVASSRLGGGEVRSPKALLTTIATHLCLDQLKSARARREQYVGQWLPEPLLTEDRAIAPLDTVEQRESISLGFLMLMERLSPPERAVFVLHEAFGYTFDEIGTMLGKSGDASRQLYHRAVRRLADGRVRFQSAPEAHRLLAEQFLSAAQGGDPRALADLLASDAVLLSDGGGKAAAAPNPITGPDRIVRFLLGILARAPRDFRIEVAEVNGKPGYVAFNGNLPVYATGMDVVNGRVQALHIVANPDKLAYLARQLTSLEPQQAGPSRVRPEQ